MRVVCARCKYHYHEDAMVAVWNPPDLRQRQAYICADAKACNGRIARRKADREAVGK